MSTTLDTDLKYHWLSQALELYLINSMQFDSRVRFFSIRLTKYMDPCMPSNSKCLKVPFLHHRKEIHLPVNRADYQDPL